MSQYGRAAAPPAAGSIFVFGVVAVVGAFTVAQGLTNISFTYTMGAVAALILFALAFVRTDFGIYVVIFSMLLSPQFGSKGAGVGAAFITAAIVSVIGLAQVPSGERVSAPFEGEIGEPNTFGGYLLFMMAIAAGVAFETESLRRRAQCLILLGLMAVPFFFTLSRASYLGLIPAFLVIARYTTRRRFVVGLILFGLVLSPALVFVAPKAVKDRVTYTFKEEKGSDTVRVGKVAFDPSTSARLISFKSALAGFARRPIFGWGVTGFGFMDAQYARVLAETGLVGLAAFLWLMWAVGRHALGVYATRGDPEERGLVLGFLAGFAGLLIHGFGSNTFIIVRIMEPFWLITGIVMMIPALEAKERAAAAAAAAPKAAPAAPKQERARARPRSGGTS